MNGQKNTKIIFVTAICALAAIAAGAAVWKCSASPAPTASHSDLRESMNNRFIQTEEIRNARQLGGYIGADGRKVKDGLLIRTGGLDKLSPEAAAQLAEAYSIQYVVDFRMGYERERAPDQEIPGAQNVWIDLYEVDLHDPEMVELMRRIAEAEIDLQKSVEYAKSGRLSKLPAELLLRDISQQGYRKFFDILLDADGAVLWHCTHGKDRTGVAAALLLYALGVDEDVIMEDFLLTNAVYQEDIARLEAELQAGGYDEAVVREAQAMAGVKGEYLKAAFDAVKQEYGSIENYLRSQLGLDEEKQQLLREKYLDARCKMKLRNFRK